MAAAMQPGSKLRYPEHNNLFTASLQFTDTILQSCTRSGVFWSSLGIHGFFYWWRYGEVTEGLCTEETEVKTSSTQALTSLLIYCLCLYVNQAYSRYWELYLGVRKTINACLQIESMLRLSMQAAAAREKALDYVLAAVALFYYQLCTGRGEDPRGTSWELDQLVTAGLLSDEEADFLIDYPGIHSWLILNWGLQHSGIYMSELNHKLMQTQVNRLYHQLRVLVELQARVFPFRYFHCVGLLITINVVSWSYQAACNPSSMSTAVFAFMVVLCLGLRDVVASITDPFGSDSIDFPMSEWLRVAFNTCLLHQKASNHKELEDPDLDIGRDSVPMQPDLFVGFPRKPPQTVVDPLEMGFSLRRRKWRQQTLVFSRLELVVTCFGCSLVLPLLPRVQRTSGHPHGYTRVATEESGRRRSSRPSQPRWPSHLAGAE
mmetsp:Transcript_95992/g.220071  ORF Transcript_95992/g.220071 Transcript_95992/m.220071 type:complete len:432 (+) Transcript_95992:36-1331(+)